ARQHAAGGVEVAADQALVRQERALQVVPALGGREEPVADQVARADLQRERLADLDILRSVDDEQRRVLVGRADLTERGADAAVAVLEPGVRGQLAVAAVVAEDLQRRGGRGARRRRG